MGSYEYLQTMYMLILLGFVNACTLCICWLQSILWTLVNYVFVDSNRFFLILANYVYVDSNSFFIIPGNYVYVDSTESFECLYTMYMLKQTGYFITLVNYVYDDSAMDIMNDCKLCIC